MSLLHLLLDYNKSDLYVERKQKTASIGQLFYKVVAPLQIERR